MVTGLGAVRLVRAFCASLDRGGEVAPAFALGEIGDLAALLCAARRASLEGGRVVDPDTTAALVDNLFPREDLVPCACADLARDARDLGVAFCSAFLASESCWSLDRVTVVSVGVSASDTRMARKHILAGESGCKSPFKT
jgi:hypothetical protein